MKEKKELLFSTDTKTGFLFLTLPALFKSLQEASKWPQEAKKTFLNSFQLNRNKVFNKEENPLEFDDSQ